MKLRAKLLSVTLLLTALIGAGAVFLLRFVLVSHLEEALHRRGISIARSVAGQSADLLVTESVVDLQLLAAATRAREEGVAYLFIADHKGRVVVHTFAGGFPSALRTANAAAGGRYVAVRLDTELGPIYDIAMPVAGGELGVVRLGMDEAALLAAVRRVQRNAALVALLCAGAFAAAALAADFYVVRRLDELAAGARALALGELEHRVPVRSRDELGELAATFNDMAVQLDRAEDKLVDINLLLQREVSERRRAEEELARRYEELKALDRLKDGFIRDVSHELKTPVAKQAMQLELLRGQASREGFLPQVEKALGVMEGAVRRQQRVIGNLLGLSRLEAGARPYRRERLRLDELLRRVLADYRPELESRAVTVTADLAPLSVESDGEMLWHVFSNLLTNAMKFQKSPRGGAVDVRLSREGAEAVVRVRDAGIGLSPEELARVFERFYQATPSSEGSGVGLTISRMIVEGVGGRIWFESAGRGEGTTASVALPCPTESGGA